MSAPDISLVCHWCSTPFKKVFKEYNRQLREGREHFFCCRSCSAAYGNAIREDRRVEVIKRCRHCGEEFTALTGAKSPVFCSRGCASAGSVSEERRRKARQTWEENCPADINKVAQGLRTREGWKYEQLAFLLEMLGEDHHFEHVVGEAVFDLALPERKTLVEFDGPNHVGVESQRDEEKDSIAKSEGWSVVRIPVAPNTVIQPSVLSKVL